MLGALSSTGVTKNLLYRTRREIPFGQAQGGLRRRAETLSEALLKTLDQLKAEGQYDSLVATLKFTGLDKKAHLALAGMAVEMTRYAPESI